MCILGVAAPAARILQYRLYGSPVPLQSALAGAVRIPSGPLVLLLLLMVVVVVVMDVHLHSTPRVSGNNALPKPNRNRKKMIRSRAQPDYRAGTIEWRWLEGLASPFDARPSADAAAAEEEERGSL